MNPATKSIALPALTVDFLTSGVHLVDNLFATLWSELGMKTLLHRAGFKKRSGAPMDELLYHLALWVWLKQQSIAMFARECVQDAIKKDALYGLMNREDLNWRRLHSQLAQQAIRTLPASARRVLVVDDTLKARSGKKMPGVSSHFDHTTGRYIMGQQVVSLGLMTEGGYVPLDDELFISQVKAMPLKEGFSDGRGVVARRYQTAVKRTKPEMINAMVKRALASGIDACHLVADAWFGTRGMIRMAQENALVPVLRMKRNKMKYRLRHWSEGRFHSVEMNAKELYQQAVRKQWKKNPGTRFQTQFIDAELDLAEAKEEAQWVKVRLLFVRGNADTEKPGVGKHDWSLFLTTDCHLPPEEMLKIYAMRWSIEVYYKEAKQHLGFLSEQSNHYAAYVASIHLTAIRYCLLVILKNRGQFVSMPDAREALSRNSTDIHYAQRLWGVFKALISGALEPMREVLGNQHAAVLGSIDEIVEFWFGQVLQLRPDPLRRETTDNAT